MTNMKRLARWIDQYTLAAFSAAPELHYRRPRVRS